MRIPAGCLAALALGVEVPVCAQETIDAQELVARCADAGGLLTLQADLRVEGGAAETPACHITLDFCRLFLVGVHLSASDFFVVDGQPGGELQIDHSVLSQSDQQGAPVNTLLRAHHLNVEWTVVDFGGSIHLETGMGDQGVVHVESVILRARGDNVKVGASGGFENGSAIVISSTLLAATDINVTASHRDPGVRGGYVDLDGNSLIADGSIIVQTGDAGRTHVQRNGALRALGDITILSSNKGQTRVERNRILGEGQVRIASGGFTSATGNLFLQDENVEIEGPICESSGNFPEIECSIGG